MTTLPTYGKLHGKQYAGFAPVTADGKNKLHYWFVECDHSTPTTPSFSIAAAHALAIEAIASQHESARARGKARSGSSCSRRRCETDGPC